MEKGKDDRKNRLTNGEKSKKRRRNEKRDGEGRGDEAEGMKGKDGDK